MMALREPLESIDTIAIKVVAVTGILAFILGLIYKEEIRNILMISFLLCVISYYMGDLVILPLTNNLVATACDFVLAFLVIWLTGLGLFNPNTPVVFVSLVSAAGIAVGECLLHILMQSVLHERSAG
ncbi:DUF2512 family protein [Aneurinibacillus aneurinilyticus]|uniref:DUF2512 family protein n=1 Tax=Aneurinibacillus aneurinilyticus ATCC 12856 TaxID=649747 RepID=U1WRE9_ANEAE|nr:DUF2512 family protein [Aneurinibacillus aneurinilyticus]ERI05215.1 hypothetical protein HMPREF0083_05789 [Aneurinibacillus aneurinilyticus ATCC 12856]MED0672406.1 DUF2512 family protein [Aneurinibacillus aneurinilyticus]